MTSTNSHNNKTDLDSPQDSDGSVQDGNKTSPSVEEIVARLDNLCDDIGLDTMSAGVAVAVAMDAGYKEFGDGQAAIEMIEEVAKGSDIGKVIGNGPAAGALSPWPGRSISSTRCFSASPAATRNQVPAWSATP